MKKKEDEESDCSYETEEEESESSSDEEPQKKYPKAPFSQLSREDALKMIEERQNEIGKVNDLIDTMNEETKTEEITEDEAKALKVAQPTLLSDNEYDVSNQRN